MTEASSTNLEMAMLLPLGVVAHQLVRIESQLRHVNMKALNVAKERESGSLTQLINARLEHINESLDSIRRLLSDIETDFHVHSTDRPRTLSQPRPDRDD